MADPLSLYGGIVASIATLIQMSETVRKYIITTAGVNEEKEALLREINSAKELLQKLETKASAPEWKNTLESMQEPKGYLESYRSALQEVVEKLKPSTTRVGKVTSTLTWYFKKGEFADILSKVHRSRENFEILLDWYTKSSVST